MNQTIQLKIKKLPRALAELAHSNQFLKISAFCSYGICLLLVTVCFYQSAKPPVVFSFAPDASVFQNAEMPKPENEIRQAIKQYVEKRYRWEPKTVREQIDSARAFVAATALSSFSSGTSNVVRFSTDKNVSQRVYPYKIAIDMKTGVASVIGDRITEIQGLKAAGDLKLQLTFNYGPRTAKNPWGVYITKEKEEI
ncbi:MAG: hypothetical protein K2Q26_11330 [Bdellovibrionales bacterium]|nr:hypothetical protein [Bdellovibrionales bacterium]